ncbi:MAG TPA: hypothetical protein VFG75_13390 [Gaiella sp.]|jgi:hypothetical protein|nr:hypothetical protein [Gaiella sp.]
MTAAEAATPARTSGAMAVLLTLAAGQFLLVLVALLAACAFP